MKKFKAILFDLDGTLRFNLPSAGEVFIEYVRKLNIQPISEKDRIRAEQWELQYFASSSEINEDYPKYKDDQKGFWLNFTKRRLIALGLPETKASALAPQASAYMDVSFKPKVHVPEEVFSLLTYLQSEGYILGVVSNRDLPFNEELASLNLTPYFNFILAAGEVKSYKPEPFIFQYALELSGTSAAETMYVGDNYYADIIGALRAGLMPVLYDPTNLFPEASEGCTVINHYSEFYELLK